MLENRAVAVSEPIVARDGSATSTEEQGVSLISRHAGPAPVGVRHSAHGDVNPDEWAHGFFTPRCRSRLSKDDAVGVYQGRCQMMRGHDAEHGFKDGFIVVLWRVATQVR